MLPRSTMKNYCMLPRYPASALLPLLACLLLLLPACLSFFFCCLFACPSARMPCVLSVDVAGLATAWGKIAVSLSKLLLSITRHKERKKLDEEKNTKTINKNKKNKKNPYPKLKANQKRAIGSGSPPKARRQLTVSAQFFAEPQYGQVGAAFAPILANFLSL